MRRCYPFRYCMHKQMHTMSSSHANVTFTVIGFNIISTMKYLTKVVLTLDDKLMLSGC
jgi:hypothetical protein